MSRTPAAGLQRRPLAGRASDLPAHRLPARAARGLRRPAPRTAAPDPRQPAAGVVRARLLRRLPLAPAADAEGHQRTAATTSSPGSPFLSLLISLGAVSAGDRGGQLLPRRAPDPALQGPPPPAARSGGREPSRLLQSLPARVERLGARQRAPRPGRIAIAQRQPQRDPADEALRARGARSRAPGAAAWSRLPAAQQHRRGARRSTSGSRQLDGQLRHVRWRPPRARSRSGRGRAGASRGARSPRRRRATMASRTATGGS